jgi:hypothetical protein
MDDITAHKQMADEAIGRPLDRSEHGFRYLTPRPGQQELACVPRITPSSVPCVGQPTRAMVG